MASDVVDYEESRSGRRLDGLVFSTYLFSLKIGGDWRGGGGLDHGVRQLFRQQQRAAG